MCKERLSIHVRGIEIAIENNDFLDFEKAKQLKLQDLLLRHYPKNESATKSGYKSLFYRIIEQLQQHLSQKIISSIEISAHDLKIQCYVLQQRRREQPLTLIYFMENGYRRDHQYHFKNISLEAQISYGDGIKDYHSMSIMPPSSFICQYQLLQNNEIRIKFKSIEKIVLHFPYQMLKHFKDALSSYHKKINFEQFWSSGDPEQREKSKERWKFAFKAVRWKNHQKQKEGASKEEQNQSHLNILRDQYAILFRRYCQLCPSEKSLHFFLNIVS